MNVNTNAWDSYDTWFFSPLNEQKLVRRFNSQAELDEDVMNFVTECVVEDLRVGGVETIDWLIEKVFGGEDEFKKAIAERIKKDDPIYTDSRDEYLELYEPKIEPGY